MGPSRPRLRRSFRPCPEAVEARRLMAASVAADVLTYHDDNARTGQDLAETTLTPANVNAASFGEKFTDQVDGAIYAQPLYMANVNIPGQGVHNIVIVATQHDSLYAFDADTPGPALWHDSFINPSIGVTSVPTIQNWQLDLSPEIGITGTPVIDPTTGTLYVAAKTETKDSSAAGFHDTYTLHAINVTTGAETSEAVIDPSVPGKGAGSVKGVVSFNAYRELQRPALLLANGVVYVSFGSLGGQAPYHGWVVGYNASTLKQTSVFNTTPNSNDPSGSLGGIWNDGAGPAADAQGNIYLLSGSGPFSPGKGGNYSDAALKFTPTLKVADYFAPQNTAYLDKHDYDLGSGGAILVPSSPGSSSNLLVGGGKLGILFAIKTAKLGHQEAKNPSVQSIPNLFLPNGVVTASTPLVGQNIQGGFFSSPAYFDGNLYVNAVGDVLKQYQISNGKIVGPVAESSDVIGYPGANISVSADGSSNGIVWTLENSGTRTMAAPAVLHAYNAADVAQELYTSATTAATNQVGSAVKFAVPTVANGKVYVGTKTGVTVYGPLG